MESRIFFLFLKRLLPFTALMWLAGCSMLQQSANQSADADDVVPPVIEPEVERREIRVPKIDSENFEIGVYGGLISIEDFETNTVLGLRAAFHATEDIFLEAVYGKSEAGRTSFEVLSGAAELLTQDEREFTYYNLSLGYNVFPGDVFVGRKRAFNTSVYAIAGAGTTKFAGDNRFTINAGFGFRLIANDWLAFRADVRDHLFDIDLLGEEKTSHNIEYQFGFTFFF